MNAPARATTTGHIRIPVWMDRLVGLIACLPFVWTMWLAVQQEVVPIETILLCVNLGLVALTMVARRAPTRVTSNPWLWLLAFVATYWIYLTEYLYPALAAHFWPQHLPRLYNGGAPLVSHFWSAGVSVLGSVISIWARVCLGRNIGFVPAERKIVTTGLYGHMRHPVYTGLFLVILGSLLAYFSWSNLILTAVWISLWVVKTFVEENFLKKNPEYAEYMAKVRWRWIPYVA